MNVTLKINKIKNSDHAEFELPLEKGLYAFVGENGCRKNRI